MNQEEKEKTLELLAKARLSDILSWIFLGELIDQSLLNLIIGKVTIFAFSLLLSAVGFFLMRQIKANVMEKLGIVDEESRQRKLKELTGKDVWYLS